MSEFITKELYELAVIDKEQLSPSTNPDYEFYYIDISSVSTNTIKYPAHSIRFATAPSRARKILHDGDILMSTVRPNLKAFAIFKEPANRNYIASTGFAVLSQKNETCLEYIFYSLFSDSVEKQIETLVVGSNYPAINTTDIYRLRIKIPLEVYEQRKITRILSTADAVIDKTRAAIAKYKAIKQGMLHDLFTRGLVKREEGEVKSEERRVKREEGEDAWQLRPKPEDAPQFYKDSPLGKIPKEWEVERLEDCIDKNTIITYGIVQTGEHVQGGIRVLRTINLNEDGIDSSSLLRTTQEISDSYRRTLVKENDIVCNVRASVGDFNIITKDLVGCNLTRGVARISIKDSINPVFMLWFLRTEKNKKQMELLIKGTTFIDINIADLRTIQVVVPHSKVEQDIIAERISAVDAKIKTEEAYLAKLQSIKAGLMADLLSGKKRVRSEE